MDWFIIMMYHQRNGETFRSIVDMVVNDHPAHLAKRRIATNGIPADSAGRLMATLIELKVIR